MYPSAFFLKTRVDIDLHATSLSHQRLFSKETAKETSNEYDYKHHQPTTTSTILRKPKPVNSGEKGAEPSL